MTIGTSGKPKTWIGAVGVAAAAAAAALLVLPILLSARLEAADVAARLGAWVGADVTHHGEPTLSLFPVPAVSMSGVHVTRRTAPGLLRLAVPQLYATLRVLPLLAGRLEVATLYLETPWLHLPGPSGDLRDAAAAFPPFRLNSRGPDMVVVRDGVMVRGGSNGDAVVRAADLHVQWDYVAQAAAVSGSFTWRGRTVGVDAALEQPSRMFSDAGAMGRLALAFGPDLGPVQLEGTFRMVSGPTGAWQSLSLDDARLGLADSIARGSLALSRHGRRWHVNGALDADHLDLSRHLAPWLPDSVAELLALPVSSRWLGRADVDLRLAAEVIDCDAARLTDAVVDLTARRGRARLTLAGAGLAGGSLDGSLDIAPAGRGLEVELAGRARDVSLAEAGERLRRGRTAALIGAERRPRGVGTAAFHALASGDSVGGLWRSLTGRAALDVRDGSIDGADTVSTLQRVADGEADIAGGHAPFIPIAGRTHFSRLTARVVAEQGVARGERIRLAGDRFEITLSGEVDLTGGELTGAGTASLFQAGADQHSRVLVELPFGIGGTMRDPMGAPGIPRLPEGTPSTDTRRAHCCRQDPRVG